MTLEIKNTKDVAKAGLRLNTLSIGDSGKGKTYMIGSMVECGYNPFVVDAEGGVTTVCDKDIDYVTVNKWAELEEAYVLFLKTYKEKGYTHFVVDSITRLQQYLVNELDPSGKITRAQWGEVLAKLRKFVDVLTKQCPVPVHMTAMAMESEDEITKMKKVYPNIQGAFKHDLAGYFDVTMYHDCGEKNKEQVYWVQTQGDQRITARNRASQIKKLNKFEVNDYKIIKSIITEGEK